MKVEQLSIFLENKSGRLAEVTRILAEASVNIKAISLADTSEFGILRMIVDDPDKAKSALKAGGFTVGLTSVVAVEVEHRPGGLNTILQTMGGSGVNVEYMYDLVQGQDKAVIIMRSDDVDAAIKVLQDGGCRVLDASEVYNAS